MITVREGRPEDCEKVYQMVGRMIHEWTGIEDWIWPGSPGGFRHLIFEIKKAHLTVAYYGEEMCGYCFYTESASSLNCMVSLTMENFYVKPEFRRKGVGTAMFRFMQELTVKKNLLGLEWFSLLKNEGDNAFFEAMGQVPGYKRITYHWNNDQATGKKIEKEVSAREEK